MNLTAVGCDRPIRDRSRTYIILNNVFGTLSGVFVLQRVAYKIWFKVGLGSDDLMAAATVLIGLPSTVIGVYKVADHTLGRDIWTLTPSQITDFGRYFWIMEILYFLEVSMLKLSLILFYIRIFPGQTVRTILWITFAACAAFGLSFALVSVFQCTPISFYWEKWDGEHHGTCLNINSIAWSNAAISIAFDIWVLAIPLWQIKDLHLDWRRKVGVALMFCMGALQVRLVLSTNLSANQTFSVAVVSILRLRSLIKFGSNSLNPTWDFLDVGIWSVVEINVGLICVCLPSLRVLLVRIFPRLQGTTERYARSSKRSRSNKRASRLPLGHSARSQVDKSMSHPNVGPNRIALQRSYTVEYGDTDEVQLVSINDRLSAKSDSRSDIS